MEVKIWKDPSDGTTRVRVYQSSPGTLTEQRFRLYPPDYNGNNAINSPSISGGSSSLTWEFCMEKEYYDRFIKPYPNSAQGSFNIALERRYSALGGHTDWREKEKQEHTYTITANEYTSPTVEYISVTPTAQLLNDPGLYVQGKNGVLVNFTPFAKVGTSIAEAYWYLSSEAKYPSGTGSPNFVNTGRASIRIVARDMRGITTEVTREIDVYPYYAPSIAPGAGEVSVVAKRVDSKGNFSDAGQSVLVKAKKSFAPLNGKNYCTLSYSRREATSTSWGEAKELVTDADGKKILEEPYSKEKAYYIRLTVADAFESRSLELAIPDERVFMDRSGNMNSIAFGGHVTERDAFEVYFDAYFRGGFYLDNPTTGERYKVTISEDGHLIATKEQTTFTLRR
jgi:hypothetical protein